MWDKMKMRMKILITIPFIIGFFLLSCKQGINHKRDKDFNDRKIVSSSQNHEENSLTTKIKTSNNEASQQINADKDKVAEVDKLQQELNDLKESTKRIIESNQSIPTIRIDSAGNRFDERMNYYLGIPCDDNEYKGLNHFSIQFNDQYINSSKKTGKYDGTAFCLRQVEEPNLKHSRIIFRRSEGGHTSDEITLITANNQQKLIFILPLSYYTGWDGHETTVKSKLKENIIIREITERYGWSNMHPDSLSNQPRRVVTQQIKVNENGRMEVVDEIVVKYNIDKLFD